MIQFIENLLNVYIEQIDPKHIMDIIETVFARCTIEKSNKSNIYYSSKLF